MTREEWAKEVRKVMIDRDMKMVDLACGIGFSTEYTYQTLNGRRVNPNVVRKISELTNVDNYLEG